MCEICENCGEADNRLYDGLCYCCFVKQQNCKEGTMMKAEPPKKRELLEGEVNYAVGYNDAIDDFHKWIDKAPIEQTLRDRYGDGYGRFDVVAKIIRELLKGGDNERD